MLDILATAFVTFLVIVDPLGVIPLFVSLTHEHAEAERRAIARRATLVAASVLVAFGVLGDVILQGLGISLAALRIAGGVLLLLLSIDMIFARQTGLRSTTASEREEAFGRHDVSVFPLAIPTIAGPGAISSVILLAGQQAGRPLVQGAIVLVMLAVLAINLLALFAAARVMRWLGLTGINVIGRVFGIVLAALSVQFVLDGVREAFHMT